MSGDYEIKRRCLTGITAEQEKEWNKRKLDYVTRLRERRELREIMCTASFRDGFAEVRAGKPLDPDKYPPRSNDRILALLAKAGMEADGIFDWDISDRANYEVGRQFAVIASGVDLLIGEGLNPTAFEMFVTVCRLGPEEITLRALRRVA